MHSSLTYLVFQREKCPTTGRLHWQGFAQAKNPKSSFSAWQKAIGDKGAHIEKRWGTATQARDYCMAKEWPDKDRDIMVDKGQIPDTTEEHGEFDPKENEGKRNDLEEARQTILGKRRWKDVVNDPDIVPVVAKNMSWAKMVFANKPPPEWEPPDDFEDWRPWQQQIIDIVTEECNDRRSIWWFYDPKYKAGKSTLAEYLVYEHDAAILSGKTADVLHGYDDEPIAIFDIPKDAPQEWIPYGAIEKIKDGLYFSGKYEGRVHKRGFKAHVIVFANCLPKEGCWDPARTKLVQLSEPEDPPQFAS